jgi:hypothetical protein
MGYEAYMSPAQEPGEESEVPKPLGKSLGPRRRRFGVRRQVFA